MANCWYRDSDGSWVGRGLGERAVRLDAFPPKPYRGKLGKRGLDKRVVVIPRAVDGKATWVLLAGERTSVRVNGYPLSAGMRLLEHRDEIRVAGSGVVWFSTETLARVEAFPGSERPLQCARTKVDLTQGMPSVRCPGCRTWYAQTDRFPGFTYAATCVMCRHPTDLDAGFRWLPGDA